MAKVIGPLHSTEARGVIGGLIYNTWKGIRYVKRMTSPCQPRTQLALQIRAWMITLVRSWQALSSTAQGDWNDYADAHPLLDWTGIAKRVTGCNWYCGLNTRLKKMGFTISDTPPAVAAPPALVNFAAGVNVAEIALTWTSTGGTDKELIFWLQGPHSKGMQGKIERARFNAHTNGEGAGYQIPVSQIGRYTVWAYVMLEANGLISTAVSDTADIVALV